MTDEPKREARESTQYLTRGVGVALLFMTIGACNGATEPATRSPSSSGDPLLRADEAVHRVSATLREKLVDAIKTSGTAKAVDVCSGEGPALYTAIKKETGATVGRASLRLRNPEDAPPAWVAEWLAAQGERKSNGVQGVRTIVDTKSGKVARVLVPVGVSQFCLACHGEPADIAPDVRAALNAKYPKDAATGYHTGDLRGAIWAELPVDR